MDKLPRIALLGTFVGRGRERQVGEICAAQGAFYTLAAPATGTAASEVLQVLGIGETSRTLTLSLVPAPLIPRLRQELRDRLFMTQPGQGILFTVPLSGINARSARWLSQGMDGKPVERSEPPMAEANFELILALTNRGCSDEVMTAARLAGATGGTLLHTRMLGGQEADRFLGIQLQKEKELVAILAKGEYKVPIMQTIADKAGLQTPAETVVLSLPVDSMEGLR